MITTLIVTIISIFMNLVSAILPAWRLPDVIVNAFSTFINAIVIFSAFDSFVAIATVLIVIFSFEITILTARLIAGLLSLIRGGGKIDI